MKVKMRFIGGLFMTLGVLLGALGSHYVKSILSPESLNSFEVGVRYLIYHGLGMLVLSGIEFPSTKTKKYVYFLMLYGTIVFSLSIIILSFKNQLPFSLTWLGPITPLGGVALITAWILTTLAYVKKK